MAGRRASVGRIGSWALLALSLSSCGKLAGLDDKLFVDDPPPQTADAGSSSLGGAGRDASGSAGHGAGGSSAGSNADAGSAGSENAPCADVSTELCMRPPWPEGVIPYARGADLTDALWENVRSVIRWEWQGVLIGASSLQFVEETIPEVPTLVFTLGEGCGPVARSAEAITVALAACPNAISRSIGVALGLPRMHQRADRDRYLELADRSHFDCAKGHVFDPCPSVGGHPALLGPFNISSLMFAPGNAREPGETCALEPEGSYLYLPRAPAQGSPCSWADGTSARRGELEQAAIAELYAIPLGWSPFVRAGRDLDAKLPAEAGGPELWGVPVLVAGPGARLSAIANANSTEFWVIENDGEAWGAWEKLQTFLPAAAGRVRAAHVRAGSKLVDVVTGDSTDEAVFHHALYDPELRTLRHATRLEAPVQNAVRFGVATLSDASVSVFLYYAYVSDDPLELHVRAREFDGTAWSEWQPLPGLAENPGLGSLAVAGTPDGTRHLIANTSHGLRYASRRAGSGWSDWSVLTEHDVVDDFVDIDLVALGHELELIAVSGARGLWQLSCKAHCDDAAAWSRPTLIGGFSYETNHWDDVSVAVSSADRMDVTAIFDAFGGSYDRGLWHKRWERP